MNRASQKSCFATLTPLLPMSTVAQALLETEKSNSFLQSATVQKKNQIKHLFFDYVKNQIHISK
jgi:hypothetical protein